MDFLAHHPCVQPRMLSKSQRCGLDQEVGVGQVELVLESLTLFDQRRDVCVAVKRELRHALQTFQHPARDNRTLSGQGMTCPTPSAEAGAPSTTRRTSASTMRPPG